ncbi:MAG: hypothetical protein N3I35_02200 [Clostridia bacterium]|nr:hypothetical protein [Clostridia bacterium]
MCENQKCNCAELKTSHEFEAQNPIMDKFEVSPGEIPDIFPTQYRKKPVSGTYKGYMTEPLAGKSLLELRVDIDTRHKNSPVMKKISGDLYSTKTISIPSKLPVTWQTYVESWVLDKPQIEWSKSSVAISGTITYSKSGHPTTTIAVTIPRKSIFASDMGEATVEFTSSGGGTAKYLCPWLSNSFRKMTMEIDVCQSVNTEPLLPSYDTLSHSIHPADLPQRTLTIEKAYKETGVDITISNNHTVINDSAAQFSTWSVSELHDAMETSFSQYSGSWPSWKMWGLLAGKFDSSSVAGIMFDAPAANGGAGETPDRQGFAVFRKHSWFNDLTDNAPANQAQAFAARQYLYTWVHEAGHAFNLLHSWNKGRPNALSWMNYPQYVTNFWNDFRFRFDDEELIHIRHGFRNAVIMGGDAWGSGGHLDDCAQFESLIEGDAPVEFHVRSKEYFSFMEPVSIEFRIRNLLKDIDIDLNTRLNPVYGSVFVTIRKPDGKYIDYSPAFCKIATPKVKTLKSAIHAKAGEDRYSEEVYLGFGSNGFYFDAPGEYAIQALYLVDNELVVPSNIHKFRVGYPVSKDDDCFAQDYFNNNVGLALYMNGSQSPYLSKAMDVLLEATERYKGTYLGAKVASSISTGFARDFHRIQEGALTKVYSGDPGKALDLTNQAIDLYRNEGRKSDNLAYHKLVRTRINQLEEIGNNNQAKEELNQLLDDLKKRGVKQLVLREIKGLDNDL